MSYPEYNSRGTEAPPGWYVVFLCAVLHMASRVMQGKRYTFPPFVYDDEGAKFRER